MKSSLLSLGILFFISSTYVVTIQLAVEEPPHAIQHTDQHLKTTRFALLQWDLQLRQETHEAEVGKDPAVHDREAQERAELGEELQLAEKQREARHDAGDHAVEHAHSQVAKGFRDAGVGVSFRDFVRMRQMHHIVD